MMDANLMARIRQRAYEIWEDEGRPEGRDRIHWLRAEAEFREKFSAGQPSNPDARLRLQRFCAPPPRPLMRKH